MRKSYSCLLSCIIILACGVNLHAQNPWGIQTSNYGGIYAADLQPAMLADNRIATEFNFGGGSIDIWNNYIKYASPLLRSADARNRLDTAANGLSFFPDNLNTKEKDLYLDATIFGPGLLFSFPNGIGIALTSKQRNLVSMNNISEVFAKQSYEEQEYAPFYNVPTNNPGLSINSMSFMEYGLGIGAVIFDKGNRVLKAGATIKYLSGFGGLSLHAWQGSYTFHDDSLLSVADADVSYAHSAAFDDLEDFDPTDFLFSGNTGLAVDIGVVYEFRPRANDYKYGLGKYRKHRPDKDAYKGRIGISLLDFGGINFGRSAMSQNFFGSVDSVNLDQLDINDVPDMDRFFLGTFATQTGASQFRMRLPSRVSLQGDYRFTEKFATQAILTMGLGSPSFRRLRAQNGLAVVPRFDTKHFGFSVPIVWQGFNSLNAGASLRLGPLFVGSNNLFNIFLTDFSSTVSAYAGLRLAIPYGKPKDKDHDGILNKEDECPKEPGLVAYAGCPEPENTPSQETENVEVTAEALWPPVFTMPEIGTLAVFESKIIPQEDTLPQLASTEKPVEKDSLPPVAVAEVPPTKVDEVPAKEVVVKVEEKPEPKKEVIAEVKPEPKKEVIPETKPEPKNEVIAEVKPPLPIKKKNLDPLEPYLPYGDRDGDGVPNVQDACPDIPGVPKNEGCPELGVGKTFYRSNIYTSTYFDSDVYALRPRGKEILENLIDYLKKNPNATLIIEGHTDNSGAEMYNTDLSLNRSMEVLKYLVFRGIAFERLEVAHYGERFPAAKNDSSVGMQLNRRVDITIVE